MKQVCLDYRTGDVAVVDVPAPVAPPGGLLVRTVCSVVSAGTEKLMTDLARRSLLGKAMARPDELRRLVNKARTEGVMEAYRAASARLDRPEPLGYSSAGEVVGVGDDVAGFVVGDRVACSGPGFASHAEFAAVPSTLCVRIPDGVDHEAASFVMLGAIAMHGVRSAEVALGDRVVVVGLGLLGQIAVQILKAAGCEVFGTDIIPDRVEFSRKLGADDGAVMGREEVVTSVLAFTGGAGADAVLIFAGTPSNEPIELAGDVCRERARIVAVGAVGLDIPRNEFFEKELSVVVSRASGPGSHDSAHQRRGADYPISFVRWTERRNMEAFLRLLQAGSVDVSSLITHRLPIDRATEAYDLLSGKQREPYMGMVLTYPGTTTQPERERGLHEVRAPSRPGAVATLGVIGAGGFVKGTLLPLIGSMRGVRLKSVATSTGISAGHAARKFGFERATADYREILEDPEIDSVLIGTRHDLHARLVAEAIAAGKHVFVEKPLALNDAQLEIVAKAHRADPSRLVLVGFNRRFSPCSVQAGRLLARVPGRRVVHCGVNAGSVSPQSWVADPQEGGGRIVGEVCHFVDLIQFFTGSQPDEVFAYGIASDGAFGPDDNLSIVLKMSDGSVGSIVYVANGDRAYPRERVEIFTGGTACAIENFRSVTFASSGRKRVFRRIGGTDRGHRAELETFFLALRGESALPDLRSSVWTTAATFRIVDSLKEGRPVRIGPGSSVEHT